MSSLNPAVELVKRSDFSNGSQSYLAGRFGVEREWGVCDRTLYSQTEKARH